LEKMQLILNLNAEQLYLQFGVALNGHFQSVGATPVIHKKKDVQRNLTYLSGLGH